MMKYLEEYRDTDKISAYLNRITSITAGSWNIMEVCGGQTHAILKYGINQILP
jgi:hydrogenase expression/formation protein HypD